jgi:hypothetical protein
MLHLRPVPALLAIAAICVACRSPAATFQNASGGASAAAGQASASQGSGGEGSAAGGANGSVTYQISGDYTASGELQFVPLGASTYADGGWVAYFAETSGTGSAVIQLNTNPATPMVNFGSSEMTVIGTEASGCTFNFSRNDSSGLAGTFECRGVMGAKIDTATELRNPVRVDFSGEWDARA